MNVNRKLELAKQSVLSITRHDDVSLAVRQKAVDVLKELLDAEMTAAGERQKAKEAAELAAVTASPKPEPEKPAADPNSPAAEPAADPKHAKRK